MKWPAASLPWCCRLSGCQSVTDIVFLCPPLMYSESFALVPHSMHPMSSTRLFGVFRLCSPCCRCRPRLLFVVVITVVAELCHQVLGRTGYRGIGQTVKFKFGEGAEHGSEASAVAAGRAWIAAERIRQGF